MSKTIVFEDFMCNCRDFECRGAPDDHDDGFGCTNQDCGCIAGWIWDLTEDMP